MATRIVSRGPLTVDIEPGWSNMTTPRTLLMARVGHTVPISTCTCVRPSSSVYFTCKGKGKFFPLQAQRVGRGIALLFHDRGTRRGEWSAARPGRTLLPGKTRYPFYRRLGGPQGRSGRAENLVPTGIRSRTVQPVVSRHTDRATRTTYFTRGTVSRHTDRATRPTYFTRGTQEITTGLSE